MQTELNRLITHDLIENYFANDMWFEAEALDIELSYLNDTLTPEERQSYLTLIRDKVFWAVQFWMSVYTVDIYQHFITTTEDYVITSLSLDGFDYNFTKKYVDTFTPAAVTNYTTPEQIYVNSFTSQPFFGYDELLTMEGAIFWIMQTTGSPYRFLSGPLFEVQNQITKFTSEIENLSSQISTISIGVSATNIAVLVATAMATRINEKKTDHELSKIQHHVTDGKIEIVPDSDRFSIGILLIAAILSISGLIVPILLA